MSIDLRLPSITATSTEGKLQQLQSYMHQLVEQLNWALSTVETAQRGEKTSAVRYERKALSSEEAEDTFNSIKALIIKSADIVRAYEQTIKTNFNGTYFADSDFGQYKEQTEALIEENSKGLQAAYTNIQTITNENGTGALDVLEQEQRITEAYIRRGLLEYDKESGAAIYGLEVGQTVDGSFCKCARFTAEKLSFYDINDKPVAYIGSGDDKDPNCLYVTGKAVFQGEIQLGKYKTDSSDGLAFTWIGG